MKAKLKRAWLYVKGSFSYHRTMLRMWRIEHPDEFWAVVAGVSLFTLLCVL